MTSTAHPAAAALPGPLRLPLAVAGACSGVVVAVLAVLYATEATGTAFDASSAAALRATGPAGRRLALAIDWGGQPAGAVVLVAALIALCLALGRPRLALLAAAGVGTTVVVTTLLKPLVGRTIHGDNLSYPSGHTALATTLAVVIALLAAGKLRAGAVTGTLLVLGAAGIAGAAMAWAQVDLGAHYATDTIGGFCTALAIVSATAWSVDRIADRYGGGR